MSKILVIEPYKILRHGFAIALSNAYRVEIVPTLPEAETLLSAELVIVDGTALRQRSSLTEPSIRALQSREFPTIWIDSAGEAPAPDNDKVRRFNWPLERDTLRKAVAECLGRIDRCPQPDSKTAKAEETPASMRKPAGSTPPRSAAGAEKNVIELVDVVE